MSSSECSGVYERWWGLLGRESIAIVCDVDRTGECALARAILNYYSGLFDQVLVERKPVELTWEGLRRKGHLAINARACRASGQLMRALADMPEMLPEYLLE